MNFTRRGSAAIAATLAALGLTVAPTYADDAESASDDYRMQLVLDASGSMKEPAKGGKKIEIAKRALGSVVDDLPEAAAVGLRVYGATISSGKGACTDTQQVVAPGTGNRDDLRNAIDDYKPLGETPIGHSLQQAAEDLGDDGKRTIVLVSDGESTCSPEPCEVARKLSKDGIDLRIDVVGLAVDRKTRKQLRCIADAGHGTYYDADDAESLTRSIDTVSTRAFRPFNLTGTPLEGAARPGSAPTIEAGKQYLGTLADSNETTYYRVERTIPGSTIHIGTTTRTAPGSLGDAISMTLYRNGTSDLCGSGTSFSTGIGARRPLLSGGASSDDPTYADDPCSKADRFTIGVQNTQSSLAGEPIEIVAYEEPPLEDGTESDLPAPADVPTWSPMEPGKAQRGPVPGSSLGSAPTLDDGTYSLNIQSGETQVFAVPLDWGQRLQVQLDTTMPKAAYQNAGLYSGFEADVYGPTRKKSSVDVSEVPSDWTDAPLGNLWAEDTSRWRKGAMTPEVRYRNREADDEDLHGTAMPGYRFVEVDFSVMKDGVTIPYELTVKRFGDAGEGAPDYADSEDLNEPAAASVYGQAPDATSTSDDDTPAGATETDRASDADSGDGPPALALTLGGAGVLVVAGGVTAVAWGRRSRTG